MTLPRSAGLFVNGVSFWSPRLPGWEIASSVLAGLEGAPEASASRPSPALLPPAERRRASDAVAVATEVAARACTAAAIPPADLPCVFATAHGDLAITDYLCAILVDAPRQMSPTRFHNSVLNAAAGYWCIASRCQAQYTTISVAEYSFGAGLLEAFTHVGADERPVLYVAFDTEACGPLASAIESRGLLGTALVLSPERSEHSVAELFWSIGRACERPVTPPRPESAALVGTNAMAPCLPLFESLAGGPPRIALAISRDSVIDVEVRRLAA